MDVGHELIGCWIQSHNFNFAFDNSAAIEVLEWMSTFIPHISGLVNTDPYWD